MYRFELINDALGEIKSWAGAIRLCDSSSFDKVIALSWVLGNAKFGQNDSKEADLSIV
jgi:hypothetical protein